MNLARFWIAKFMGDEPALRQLGCPETELLAELEGHHVALVGNARSLADQMRGPEIDAADIVVRINRAPIPRPESHGTRTDWLGVSVAVTRELVAERAPQRLIWVTPRRKRLPFWMARDPRFALVPANRHASLARILGSRPTTGLMLLDLVAASRAQSITLWGFDFFATKSLTGRRAASDVPHDFAAEATYVEKLCAADPRIRRGDLTP